MRCPGCGTPIAEVRNVPVEYVTNSKGYFPGEEHTSTRCHAADPVRKAARKYLDARDALLRAYENGLDLAVDDTRFRHAALYEKAKLAALRAALEG